jgi:hypothetical protein
MKLRRLLSPLLPLVFAFELRVSVARAEVADTDAARREAASHFGRGVAHADNGAWNEAAAEFQAAYTAVPHFSVLYNLGQSYLAIDRPVEALNALERYLDEGGNQVPPSRRSRVEGQLATLRGRVATLQLTVAPVDARLAIDGREIPRLATADTPSLAHLLPGMHTISASRDGHEPRERRVQLEAGQTFALELMLVPLPIIKRTGPPANSPVATARPGTPSAAPGDRPVLGYALGAAAVVFAGTAVGVYLWNDARHAEWDGEDKKLAAEQEAPTFSPTFERRQRENNDLWRSIERVDWFTRGLVAGAAVSGTLAAFLILRRSKVPAERTQASIVAAPGGVVGAIEVGW